MRRQMAVIVVLAGAAAATLTTPPADPTDAVGCAWAGGACLPSDACPDWRQPFKGICGTGRECCFQDHTNHRLRCGLFGGDCALAKSCGRAPRMRNAYCARPGDVCCVWLF